MRGLQMPHVVAAFYKFVRLSDGVELRDPLLLCCSNQGVKGTILLAEEGINGTITGSRTAIDTVLAFLRADPRLADLESKESCTELLSFDRIKVRLKKEIVTLGLSEVDPSRQVGTYVSPHEWNALISDPDVTVIDVRNQFEVGIGSFDRAIDPHTKSFRQFPDYVRSHLASNHRLLCSQKGLRRSITLKAAFSNILKKCLTSKVYGVENALYLTSGLPSFREWLKGHLSCAAIVVIPFLKPIELLTRQRPHVLIVMKGYLLPWAEELRVCVKNNQDRCKDDSELQIFEQFV